MREKGESSASNDRPEGRTLTILGRTVMGFGRDPDQSLEELE
jgi:hypothetical protein